MEMPEQVPGNIKTNLVYATIEEVEGKIYINQTGAFPRVSSRGMQYVMVFYVFDANYIKGIVIKIGQQENFNVPMKKCMQN
eukprot:7444798-Ditylum_brightwellii.AAC.1